MLDVQWGGTLRCVFNMILFVIKATFIAGTVYADLLNVGVPMYPQSWGSHGDSVRTGAFSCKEETETGH